MMELCWGTYPEGAVYLKKLLVPLSPFFLSSLLSLSPFPSLPLSLSLPFSFALSLLLFLFPFLVVFFLDKVSADVKNDFRLTVIFEMRRVIL